MSSYITTNQRRNSYSEESSHAVVCYGFKCSTKHLMDNSVREKHH